LFQLVIYEYHVCVISAVAAALLTGENWRNI